MSAAQILALMLMAYLIGFICGCAFGIGYRRDQEPDE